MRAETPISYQWQRNGVGIPGATAATYTTSVLTLSDSGTQYSVVVANSAGTILSNVVSVSVIPVAPAITAQPQPMTVVDGASVTLTVAATGSAPLAFQWFAGTTAIVGAAASTLTFNSQIANSGQQYSVVITNVVGTVTSAPATVTVNPRAPSFSTQPQDAATTTGGSVLFSASGTGTPPVSFQWQRSMDNGNTWTAIPGETSSALSLNNATLGDADARFRIVATNAAASVNSQTAKLTVTPNVYIIAGGLGGPGNADGIGPLARFYAPFGAVADSAGNVYVADSGNFVIRRVTPSGQTSVFAGQTGQQGWRDGNRSTALFNGPQGLATDGSGNIYVTDITTVRRISPTGIVTTIAGAPFTSGSADGPGGSARFSFVGGIASDAAGNLLVSDGGNVTIRRIPTSGVVSTFAGATGQSGTADGNGAAARFTAPSAITLDASGNAFVCDNYGIRQITPTGDVTTFAGAVDQPGSIEGPRLTARFSQPRGIAFDPTGNLYVAEDFKIRRISVAGSVITVAGGGSPRGVDGTGSAASVLGATNIAPLPNGDFVFTEFVNNTVRTMTLADNTVVTIAGLAPQTGNADGAGTTARFDLPYQIAADAAGTIYVADFNNNRIRRISSNGTVTTLAGSSQGYADGTGIGVQFNHPEGIALDASGNVYVADTFNHVIRRITSAGVATTLAGSPGVSGSADGTGSAARFNNPRGIAVDANGNIFVADSLNATIRKITLGGLVSTIAGSAGQTGPANGVGSAARFSFPSGLALDATGNVYVADELNHAIRRVATDGTVTTFAGANGSPGYSDDVALFGRFNQPRAIAFDSAGNLYVADMANNTVRRVTPAGVTSTVMGQVGLATVRPGLGGAINQPRGVAVLPNGRVVVVSEQAVLGD